MARRNSLDLKVLGLNVSLDEMLLRGVTTGQRPAVLRTFYSYCTAFVVPSDCIILWILDAAAAFEWRANLVKRPVECIRVGQPNALNAAKV